MFSVSLKEYLLAIFFIFIPFSQAFTFDMGFSLKISEIAMILIILSSKNIAKFKKDDIILLLFLIIALSSFLINFLWEYSYNIAIIKYRFGENLDSLAKLIYLGFTIYYFILLRNIFDIKKETYVKFFFIGAVFAALYGWYLMLGGIFKYDPLLIFGISNPQFISLGNWTLIRSGTFLEGNYMGLFLFISTVLAVFYKKRFLAAFFTISMVTTLSTIGLLSLFLFYSYLLTKINIKYSIIISFLIVCIFASLSQNRDFNAYILSKINIFSNEVNDNGAVSREERKSAIINGIKIAIDNPVLGVGISNYAKHYNYYNGTRRVFHKNKDIKVIPNNIYVEIASELGLVAFLLFIIFLYKIYRHINNSILMGGFWACCLYFNAIPSYTIIVIWFFFAFLSSQNCDDSKGGKYAVC